MTDWYVKVGTGPGWMVNGVHSYYTPPGTTLDNVEILSLKYGYAFPSECRLKFPGKHDVGIAELTNNNEIWISNESDFSSLIFRGWLEVNSPGGVSNEGVEYTAYGLEHAANRYVIKYDNSIDYKYNLDNLPDPTSPGAGWGAWTRWTVGEIVMDILEHACGYQSDPLYRQPNGLSYYSSIPGHHGARYSDALGFQNYGMNAYDAVDQTSIYMPPTILATWDPTLIMALSLQLSEVRVTAQRFWDFLQNLIHMMDSHGIFIDPTNPDSPVFVVHDFSTSTTFDLKCGQLGTHIKDTEASPGAPLVTSNPMRFDLRPCRTKIIIEGKGRLMELNPWPYRGVVSYLRNPGRMVPYWDGTVPADIGRKWLINDQHTTPFWEGKLSSGLEGPVLIVGGYICADDFVDWDLEAGVAYTREAIPPGFWTDVLVWTLYLAPFQVTAGPGGTAYTDHGLIAEEAVYDDQLLHQTVPYCINYIKVSTYQPSGPWGNPCAYDPYAQYKESEEYCAPQPPRDDTWMMQAIADEMLARLGDERIHCTAVVDGIDLAAGPGLRNKCNFDGLAKWSSLEAQVMSAEVKPSEDTITYELTNDVFRTPGYAELKRRFLLQWETRQMWRMLEKLKHRTQLGGNALFTRRN